jgi:hypothetical protein
LPSKKTAKEKKFTLTFTKFIKPFFVSSIKLFEVYALKKIKVPKFFFPTLKSVANWLLVTALTVAAGSM